MKIDRLLGMVIYLLNRDKVTAPEMADHFDVSVRTIHRDIDTLSAAGIPVISMPGFGGGYGIMKHYRLDRQMVNADDLFFMLTSLESVAGALGNSGVENTLEKVRALVQARQAEEIANRRETLHIDFSAMKLGRVSDVYYTLDKATQAHQLISFDYTDGSSRRSERTVEPMTVVFQWTAWYLYGWCRLRSDYRLFRLSRMENVALLDEHFQRRPQSFADCVRLLGEKESSADPVILRFHPDMRVHVMDHFYSADMESDDNGYLIVKVAYPESGWLYGMLLSYGEFVEVLHPPHIRDILRESCQKIIKQYSES